MQSALNLALDIIKTLIIIDILIFVHELGHFIAAKKVGIKVLRFAIGFGPKLIGFKRGDTEYCILALPFGGYVKMAGENPAEEVPEDQQDGLYNKAPVSSRALVAISGPFMNIIFAVIAIAFAYMFGMPAQLGTEIGYIEKNSPAEKAGIMIGDKILSIDGYKTKKWDDVREGIAINPDKQIEIVLLRNSDKKSIIATPEHIKDTEFGRLGISPSGDLIIRQVRKGSPAESIGFQSGDVIIKANNKDIKHLIELGIEIDSLSKKQKIMDIVIDRDSNQVVIKLPLELDDTDLPKSLDGLSFTKIIKLNPISAFGAAIPETINTGGKVFQFLKRLIVRDVSTKYVAGPVGIIQITMSVVKTGISGILWFTGFFSVNLGIINLLPIFITDGWVLLMLMIEKIRGQALSLKKQALIQQVGIVFFILLFLLVTYNDIIRLIGNKFN